MRATEYLREYDSIQRYLNRLSEGSHRSALYNLHYFFSWVNENSTKFGEMTPDELVEFQKNAQNSKEYEILDALQDFILSLEARYHTKKLRYTYPRGFFKANRAALPDDVFRINGDTPRVQGKLTVENIRDIVLSSNKAYRAAFLCMFSGGMGLGEIIYWSNNGTEKLLDDLKHDPDYVMVDLAGRKSSKNIRPFYTIIIGDALDYLKTWIAERPRNTESIFTNQYGEPFTKNGIYRYWLRHMQGLGLVKKGNDIRHRTGRNPHELRDCFRTQWEKSPAKASVAEFAMGHVVDELGYNKAHLDERWMVSEFRKAVPLLNIMTSGRPFGRVDKSEVELLRSKNEELRRQLQENENLTSNAMAAIDELRAYQVSCMDNLEQTIEELQLEVNRLKEG